MALAKMRRAPGEVRKEIEFFRGHADTLHTLNALRGVDDRSNTLRAGVGVLTSIIFNALDLYKKGVFSGEAAYPQQPATHIVRLRTPKLVLDALAKHAYLTPEGENDYRCNDTLPGLGIAYNGLHKGIVESCGIRLDDDVANAQRRVAAGVGRRQELHDQTVEHRWLDAMVALNGLGITAADMEARLLAAEQAGSYR